MRVPDILLNGLIRHDGFLPDACHTPDSMGVLRLAMDLKDARDEIARLIAELDHLQRRQLAHSAVEVGLLEKVARLREAISEFVEAFDRDPIKYADLMDRTREAVEAICRIAREGR